MKNKLVIIILGILIILSSIAIAYKDEIKQFSEKSIQDYILERIQTLPDNQQKDFENFKELSIEDKLRKAQKLNKGSEK